MKLKCLDEPLIVLFCLLILPSENGFVFPLDRQESHVFCLCPGWVTYFTFSASVHYFAEEVEERLLTACRDGKVRSSVCSVLCVFASAGLCVAQHDSSEKKSEIFAFKSQYLSIKTGRVETVIDRKLIGHKFYYRFIVCLIKQKCQAGSRFSNMSFWLFFLLYIILNWVFLNFVLLVGKQKTFEDMTLDFQFLCSAFFTFFFFDKSIIH